MVAVGAQGKKNCDGVSGNAGLSIHKVHKHGLVMTFHQLYV